ncbi:MAG: TatD family hydrolase [Clostridia bacterium]|nr:TatD family hydrolase [Clostridia bacterium]
MPVQYCDIGLNLFSSQFHDPARILKDAEDAGVSCILTGSDMKENRTIAAYLTASHPPFPVYATCGIHPHNADHARESDFLEMKELLSSPFFVAVGECGLDYNRMFSMKENQLSCLEQHILLAQELSKPMFLHERDASSDMLAVFRRYPGIPERSVIHCFTGDRNQLRAYLDLGFSIGITGWICDDRRADAVRDAVRFLPLDRVMLETDAPYLTPRDVPGLPRVNVPGNIVYVCRTLARFMNVPEDTLRAAALENTQRFFSVSFDV